MPKAAQTPAVNGPLPSGKIGEGSKNNEHLAAGRVEGLMGRVNPAPSFISQYIIDTSIFERRGDRILVRCVNGALGISILSASIHYSYIRTDSPVFPSAMG
jgi:hypothetical protein